jgi:hypothetical protein
VAFCLVVVAIGIFIFANPPSTNSKAPAPHNSGTTGEITVPGTPASGMPATKGSVNVTLTDATAGLWGGLVRLA